MYRDSDSDDSDEFKDSDDDDNNDDEDEDAEAEEEAVKGDGSDYDSDKDPAWRPASHKSPKKSKVSPVTSYNISVSLSYFLCLEVNCM